MDIRAPAQKFAVGLDHESQQRAARDIGCVIRHLAGCWFALEVPRAVLLVFAFQQGAIFPGGTVGFDQQTVMRAHSRNAAHDADGRQLIVKGQGAELRSALAAHAPERVIVLDEQAFILTG